MLINILSVLFKFVVEQLAKHRFDNTSVMKHTVCSMWARLKQIQIESTFRTTSGFSLYWKQSSMYGVTSVDLPRWKREPGIHYSVDGAVYQPLMHLERDA